MKAVPGTGQHTRGVVPRGAMTAVLAALLLGLPATQTPSSALAHPLDQFLQDTYITVTPAQIVVELDLTPGVLVVPQVLPDLDPDADQRITGAESQAYAAAVLRDVVLRVDGQPLVLEITRIDMPTYLNLRAGYGTIRIFMLASLPDGMTGTHQLSYTNGYAPTDSAYQVSAVVNQDVPIALGKQNRDDAQQSMTLDFSVGSASAAPRVPLERSLSSMDGPIGRAQWLLDYLDAPTLSPWQLLLALALAIALGGLHAMTPGHGKTLVAAYLVGSRGTTVHAVALGAIVTFTHIASVIAIGVIALVASRFVVPDTLLPILEILSGVLVVCIGTRLIWQRWTAFRHRDADRAHPHHHPDAHDHELSYDHGDEHTHPYFPSVGGFTLANLMALGVSGGLVPCPEALGIMMIAVGLNRIVLGLGLIVAFSVGLAAVLMIIGILLVRSRSLLERFGGLSSAWSGGLQLGSALLVTVLGVAITWNGLATYLGGWL